MPYGPLDQVTDYAKQFTTYDFTTATNILYNFVTAGYALGATLNVSAKGQVQLFATDVTGAYITVKIGGVDTVLDGTTFMILDSATPTDAYIVYNLPNEQNAVYNFSALFSISGGAQKTVTWQQQTSR